jgi:hypothetical protein
LVSREKSLQQGVNRIVFTDDGKVVDSFAGGDWVAAMAIGEQAVLGGHQAGFSRSKRAC